MIIKIERRPFSEVFAGRIRVTGDRRNVGKGSVSRVTPRFLP